MPARTRTPRRRLTLALAAVTALTASACTSSQDGDPSMSSAAPRADAEPAPASDYDGSCPSQRAEPAADRPDIELEFTLGGDGRTVTGRERVHFAPDRPTDELVFRLTANQPRSAAGGSGITVGDVTGEGVTDVGFEPAGADPDSQGGLLVLALADTLDPGEAIEVTVEFVLRLGNSGFDRFGLAGGLSWWGSGHPLLAWVPGQGWSRTPLLPNPGETAVSAVADTGITVRAPSDLTVALTGGAQRGPTEGGLTRWRSRDRAARDVAVVVGNLVEARGPAEAAGGDPVDVRVVAPSRDEAAGLLARAQAAIASLSELLGPFPYPSVSLARLPDLGGGVEYPGLILLADDGDVVLVHELAHMWFYGMVGDDQGRDPWLDESFATYAELVVNGPPDDLPGRLQLPLAVGLAIGDFPGVEEYIDTVYGKGSAMLLAARAAAGEDAFDAALRCYVDALAWQIATPADVALAFADLPAALAVLRDAGALPG